MNECYVMRTAYDAGDFVLKAGCLVVANQIETVTSFSLSHCPTNFLDPIQLKCSPIHRVERRDLHGAQQDVYSQAVLSFRLWIFAAASCAC